jgi:hypothetical protein
VVVGVGVYVFVNHVGIEDASAEGAAEEFDAALKPFAGQSPLIEIESEDEVRIHRDRIPAASTRRKIETINVLVWDADDDKLVRVSLPWWLVRMKAGPVEFSTRGSPLDHHDLDLTVEDLERYGPGLLVNFEDPRGQRVLVWAQ